MPNNPNKRIIQIDKNICEDFEYLYPELLKIFVTRSIELATQDKSIFEEIFFNKKFIGVK